MPSTLINAEQFWEFYFRNEFLTLERRIDKYHGQVFDKPSTSSPGKGLLDDYAQVFVEIGIAKLRTYDYAGDGRFALLAQRPVDLGAAVEAVIKQSYPYREAAPFGKQRMAELFTQMRLQEPHTKAAPSLTALEQATLAMVEKYDEAQAQPLAALAWLLGEQRQRSSAKALLGIIRNAPFAPFARHKLPSTPVDAAFSALWKVNDKASLVDLLELLRNTSAAGQRKIVPLFERLLSTKELLSLERCGDNYYQPEFWERYLTARNGFTDLDWDRHDADALFWELRHLAALRLPPSETAILGKLAADEVQTVADAAHTRLVTR